MTNRSRVRTVSSSRTRRRGDARDGRQDHETYAVSLPTGSRSPEQWARATLEGAPAVVRLLLVIGWRGVLRLRAVPAGVGVLGWQLDHGRDGRTSRDASVVLSTQSSRMRASLTFTVRGDELTVTGRRELDGTAARLAWAVVRPIHRLLAPRLVAAAVRRSVDPHAAAKGAAVGPGARGREMGRRAG